MKIIYSLLDDLKILFLKLYLPCSRTSIRQQKAPIQIICFFLASSWVLKRVNALYIFVCFSFIRSISEPLANTRTHTHTYTRIHKHVSTYFPQKKGKRKPRDKPTASHALVRVSPPSRETRVLLKDSARRAGLSLQHKEQTRVSDPHLEDAFCLLCQCWLACCL